MVDGFEVLAESLAMIQNYFLCQLVSDAALGPIGVACFELWSYACDFNFNGLVTKCEDFLQTDGATWSTLQHFGSEAAILEMSSQGKQNTAISLFNLLKKERAQMARIKQQAEWDRQQAESDRLQAALDIRRARNEKFAFEERLHANEVHTEQLDEMVKKLVAKVKEMEEGVAAVGIFCLGLGWLTGVFTVFAVGVAAILEEQNKKHQRR